VRRSSTSARPRARSTRNRRLRIRCRPTADGAPWPGQRGRSLVARFCLQSGQFSASGTSSLPSSLRSKCSTKSWTRKKIGVSEAETIPAPGLRRLGTPGALASRAWLGPPVPVQCLNPQQTSFRSMCPVGGNSREQAAFRLHRPKQANGLQSNENRIRRGGYVALGIRASVRLVLVDHKPPRRPGQNQPSRRCVVSPAVDYWDERNRETTAGWARCLGVGSYRVGNC
jgi:hypothetical protein